MHVRDALDSDVSWLPGYILGGFDSSGATPRFDRIEAAVAQCRGPTGFALIAEHDGMPVGILGALVTEPWWSVEPQINVLALRSTRPGAGALLIRALLQRALNTFASHVAVTIENPDPRVEKMMRRFGKHRVLRTYVFRNQEA